MIIHVTHSNDFDFKKELYSPLRNSELNKEHEIFLPHETDKFINTKDLIRNADVVVAEVSFPSTGQGIELGWASDANVPIICIYKEGNKTPGSLKAVSSTFLQYKDSDEMIKKISEALKIIKKKG